MEIVSRYLENISGISIFPMISLILFVLFFSLILIHTMAINKEDAKSLSEIPLEEDAENLNNNI